MRQPGSKITAPGPLELAVENGPVQAIKTGNEIYTMNNANIKDALEKVSAFLDKHQMEYAVNRPVAPYLTIGIGGAVAMTVHVTSEAELRDLFTYFYSHDKDIVPGAAPGLPVILLGGGSNVVFPDGCPGMIVVINRTAAVERVSGGLIRVNSGVMISDLMDWAAQNGAGGMDFLAGIPGTAGGAAAVNAGAFGIGIASILEKAEIVTANGDVKTVDNDYFKFTYRNSAFKYGKEVIVNIYLKSPRQDRETVKKAIEERLEYREKNHPGKGCRSAGCFFKNPVINGEKVPAGRLIEQAGFKGLDCGTLRVSGNHANFVINSGSASFGELKKLEQEIRGKVLELHGVQLEREVIYISPDGGKS